MEKNSEVLVIIKFCPRIAYPDLSRKLEKLTNFGVFLHSM